MPQQLDSTVSTAKSGTSLSAPAFTSRARNSSNSSAFAAKRRASSRLTSDGISSRKPSMQLGSRPTNGVARSRKGASAATQRSVNEPDREEGAPAAERPVVTVGGLRQMHGIAAGGKYRERGLDVLRLEVAVKGVGKEHDRSCLRRARRARRLAPCIGAPARQAPPRAQARIPLRPLPQVRHVVAQVGESRPFGRERRVTR